MRKKILIVITLIIGITLIGSYALLTKNGEENIEKNESQIKNTNMLTMMLETEAGTGIYEEVTQSEWPQEGYVFNETLSKCENGGTITYNEATQKINMKSNTSDKCYVYFDIAEYTFAEYVINNIYTTDGANGLYYHDGTGTYTNASEEAEDNSYRYSGANLNNYVCFGSDAATCPEDNLYRIIGLFDDDNDGIYNVKLMKSTRYGSYELDSDGSNTWNETEKPDIYTILNTTYRNTLSSKWQSLVDESHQWQVGGMVWSSTNNVKQYYNAEIKNQTGYVEIMAVGLMYVSDYGYAASPENWQTALSDYDNTTNRNNNWMYLDVDEWTISRRSDLQLPIFYISNSGLIGAEALRYFICIYRPSIYLKSEIKLISGSGTSTDPYRISV